MLLAFSRAVDAMNDKFGQLANVLILLACVVSAGNALLRYSLDISDNWPLELQWYLFGAAVMLGASYTLAQNGHVRVDIILRQRFRPRPPMDRHFRPTAIPAPRLHPVRVAVVENLVLTLVGHYGTLQQFRRITALPDQIHAAARLRFASPARLVGTGETLRCTQRRDPA